MPKGNQSYFKSTNESVERYAIVTKYNENDREHISGIYDKVSHLKCGMKNGDHMLNHFPYRIVKVKITIEELEEIKL